MKTQPTTTTVEEKCPGEVIVDLRAGIYTELILFLHVNGTLERINLRKDLFCLIVLW